MSAHVAVRGTLQARRERSAEGRARRSAVPRRSHGEWKPSPSRPDPIELLEQQAAARVPELVPIRYGRMLASPFAFYRGAAAIMAADLAGTPTSGYTAQLCGDAHLSNFGVFGTAERRFVFDINDFDETCPGPWEWDLKRLVASMAVAARERGFDARQRERIVLATARGYRSAMRDFARRMHLEVWYSHLELDPLMRRLRREFAADELANTNAAIAKARTKDSLRAFSRLTVTVGGERRIISDPPLIVPIEELAPSRWSMMEDEIVAMVASYRETLAPERRVLFDQFRIAHIAHKVVGVGSVGTRAWIVLLLGRRNGDPLFLQVKEAGNSVLEPYVGETEHDHGGARVVAGQRLMQAAGDIFLGWTRVERGVDKIGRDYYVRQLHDWKGSATIEKMIPRGMAAYGRTCAWTLARAHARSGDRVGVAAYLGGGDAFDRAMVPFAEAYADQNERDYGALVDAVRSGRIEVQAGL